MVWTSEEQDKPKCNKRKDKSDQIPTIPAKTRRSALDELLQDFSHDGEAMSDGTNSLLSERRSLKEPVEHVFSHVRHTMWIEHADLDETTTDKSWNSSSQGRLASWMTECDMQKVGVTSGVKKILGAERKSRTNTKEEKPNSTKRKKKS